MSKRTNKQQTSQFFPLQELHKFIHQQKNNNKRVLPKHLPSSKAVIKNHSKSLYYHNSLVKGNKPVTTAVNRTGLNLLSQNITQQTLNEQLLGIERPKPKTSEYRSGRNTNLNNNNEDFRSNKISVRNSGNYFKLASVAGIPLNQKQAQNRMENHLSSKSNARKTKEKSIQKQNQRLASRLDSQQSQYSTKKLLKAYESQQKISKRLTESKMSKRSGMDNRSVCSEHSSRGSVASRNSRTSSIRSTSRANSSKSSARNQNRFQSKFNTVKKIKIQEHNINKMNNVQLSKFRNLFANSFSTTNNNKVRSQNQVQMTSYHHKLLKNNPQVDVEILSQHSSTSIRDERERNSRNKNYTRSINVSNKKLREVNFQAKVNNRTENIAKKASVITSDGLLHRIAEEMFDVKNMTGNMNYGKSVNRKKESNFTSKTGNPEKSLVKMDNLASRQSKRKHIIKNQMNKFPIFPLQQLFAK